MILHKLFVRRVQRCFLQSLVQIGQIAEEEFEKVRFTFVVFYFCEWKVSVKVGVAYTTQFSWIQGKRRCNG